MCRLRAAFARRIGFGDDRQASGDHEGRTDPLRGAQDDERRPIRRQRAQKRGRHEDGNAAGEDITNAVDVSGRSAQEHERRQKKHVAVVDPLRVHQRRVEIGPDRGHGQRDHRSVDEPHRRGKNRRDQNEAATLGRAECTTVRGRGSSGRDSGIGRFHGASLASAVSAGQHHDDQNDRLGVARAG